MDVVKGNHHRATVFEGGKGRSKETTKLREETERQILCRYQVREWDIQRTGGERTGERIGERTGGERADGESADGKEWTNKSGRKRADGKREHVKDVDRRGMIDLI